MANSRDRKRAQWIQGSNYDISNRCNLRCEGCLFFAGDDWVNHKEDADVAAWERLFAQEAARGVNFAYLAGAEPAMEPDILRAAYRHIKQGVVFTNGTVKIPQDIGYRLHVSIWGGSATAEDLRGVNTNRKAFKNFGKDPRAIFVMTLNPLNLHEAEEVVKECAANGSRMTFSMFTPTLDYNAKIRAAKGQEERDDYFRISDADRNLAFDDESLARAREITGDLAKRYPDTVIHSPAYFDWICSTKDMYELDANGVATNCGNSLTKDWRHYAADRTESQGKCCSPNLECSECRAYAMALGTYVKRRPERGIPGAGERWREAFAVWCELFLAPVADAGVAPETETERKELMEMAAL